MYQLYSLGAIVAVGLFYTLMTGLTGEPVSSGSSRDAVYSVMSVNSKEVKTAIEQGTRYCLKNKYFTEGPNRLHEAIVSTYLSTLSIQGVPSGKPPTNEAFNEHMKKRILVSWRSVAKAAGSNPSKGDMAFFNAMRAFQTGHKRLDACVFEQANEYLMHKGLVSIS